MASHLIVLAHGHNGNPSNLNFMERVLKLHLNSDTFLILNSESNAGWTVRVPPLWSWVLLPSFVQGKTHQGIHVGGARLAAEIEEKLISNPSIERISFIGHSLGGVYARYAIGVLASHGWLAGSSWQPRANTRKLQGVHFMTLATPHLGSLQVGKGIPAFELLTSAVNNSIEQLLLRDRKIPNSEDLLRPATDQSDSEFPLMLQLCRPPFVTALSQFEHRTVFANARYDHIVAFSTAAVCARNPLRAVNFNHETLKRYAIGGYNMLIDVNSMLFDRPTAEIAPISSVQNENISAVISSAAAQVEPSNEQLPTDQSAVHADEVVDTTTHTVWPASFVESPALRDMHTRLAGTPLALPAKLFEKPPVPVGAETDQANAGVTAATIGVTAVAFMPLLVPPVAEHYRTTSAATDSGAGSEQVPSPMQWTRIGVVDRMLTSHFDICMLNPLLSAGSAGEEVIKFICLQFSQHEESRLAALSSNSSS